MVAIFGVKLAPQGVVVRAEQGELLVEDRRRFLAAAAQRDAGCRRRSAVRRGAPPRSAPWLLRQDRLRHLPLGAFLHEHLLGLQQPVRRAPLATRDRRSPSPPPVRPAVSVSHAASISASVSPESSRASRRRSATRLSRRGRRQRDAGATSRSGRARVPRRAAGRASARSASGVISAPSHLTGCGRVRRRRRGGWARMGRSRGRFPNCWHAGSGSAGEVYVHVNVKLIKNFVRDPHGFHRIPPRLFVLNPIDESFLAVPQIRDFKLRDFRPSTTSISLSDLVQRRAGHSPAGAETSRSRDGVTSHRTRCARRVLAPRGAGIFGESAHGGPRSPFVRFCAGGSSGPDEGTSAATTGKTPPAPTPPSRRSNRRCGTFRTTRPRPRPTRASSSSPVGQDMIGRRRATKGRPRAGEEVRAVLRPRGNAAGAGGGDADADAPARTTGRAARRFCHLTSMGRVRESVREKPSARL